MNTVNQTSNFAGVLRRTPWVALAACMFVGASGVVLAADDPPAISPREVAHVRLLKVSEDVETQARKRDEEVESLRQKLRRITGRSNVASLNTAVESMEAERLKLEVDKVGLTARRDALATAIDRTAEVNAKHSREIEAEMVHDLEAQVDLRAEQLEVVKKLVAAGQATPADVNKAQGELGAANLELRRQRATPPRSSPEFEALADLNRQLVETSVALSETVARLEYAVSRLNAFAEADPLVVEMSRTMTMAADAHHRARELREQADRPD